MDHIALTQNTYKCRISVGIFVLLIVSACNQGAASVVPVKNSPDDYVAKITGENPQYLLSAEELQEAKLSAEHGNCKAAVDICYHFIRINQTEEGINWIRRSAESGNPLCMASAGAVMTSIHFPAYNKEGIKWLEKAAACGNSDAALNLFGIYKNGTKEIPINQIKANIWEAKYDQMRDNSKPTELNCK